MDWRMDAWTDGGRDGWMGRWTDGGRDAWMDGWTDGRTDGGGWMMTQHGDGLVITYN